MGLFGGLFKTARIMNEVDRMGRENVVESARIRKAEREKELLTETDPRARELKMRVIKECDDLIRKYSR